MSRVKAERFMQQHAKSVMQARADPLAERLVFLATTANYEREHDRAAYDKTSAEIRRIGQALLDLDGERYLKEVAQRVKTLRRGEDVVTPFWADLI